MLNESSVILHAHILHMLNTLLLFNVTYCNYSTQDHCISTQLQVCEKDEISFLLYLLNGTKCNHNNIFG